MVMKQSTLRHFTNCDIPNMSIKWWLKITLTYILEMITSKMAKTLIYVNGNETKYIKAFYKLWHSKYSQTRL